MQLDDPFFCCYLRFYVQYHPMTFLSFSVVFKIIYKYIRLFIICLFCLKAGGWRRSHGGLFDVHEILFQICHN